MSTITYEVVRKYLRDLFDEALYYDRLVVALLDYFHETKPLRPLYMSCNTLVRQYDPFSLPTGDYQTAESIDAATLREQESIVLLGDSIINLLRQNSSF